MESAGEEGRHPHTSHTACASNSLSHQPRDTRESIHDNTLRTINMNDEMIRCVAIDDEPLALQQLAAYIGKIPFLRLVVQCQSAIKAKRILDQEMVDAIFCDINMPDLNGMDFVKSLYAPPLVVFTTAYAEYAIEGYKVDAVDYLLKPFGLDEFRRAANKLRARLRPLSSAPSTEHRVESQGPDGTGGSPEDSHAAAAEPAGEGIADGTLFVKSDGRMIKIAVDEIVYAEGMSEYIKIYTDSKSADGKPAKPFVVLYSMKRLEERLPARFMRVHRSYIINLNKIVEVNKNRVIMGPDTFLPIGDLYKEAFFGYVNRNFLGR